MRGYDNALPIVVGLFCIVAVAMGAATLDTAEPAESGGDDSIFEPPEGGELNPGDEPTTDPEENGDIVGGQGQLMELSTCISFLASTTGTALVFAGFLLVVALVYRQFNGATAMLAGWTIFPPTMLVYFLATNCGGQSWGGADNGDSIVPNPGQSPIQPVTDVPTWLLAAVIGTVFVGAAVLLYRSAGGDELVTIEEPEDDDGPGLDQFAAAAGRAADRIEKHNADIDNSVYQAWVEMTSLLEVEKPETYAAGEFAEEAIDLGMARSDVDELTRLFNEVRYGGKDAAAREDRAVNVLRNIESQYAESVDGDDPADETDDGAATEGDST